MLKHLSKNALLYGKKLAIIPSNEDTRSNNNDSEVFRTDDNLEDREDKFANQIDSKYVCRILLKYLCNLDKINFPIKIDLKICCTMQTNMKQLFESIGAQDAQIAFVRVPILW